MYTSVFFFYNFIQLENIENYSFQTTRFCLFFLLNIKVDYHDAQVLFLKLRISQYLIYIYYYFL